MCIYLWKYLYIYIYIYTYLYMYIQTYLHMSTYPFLSMSLYHVLAVRRIQKHLPATFLLAHFKRLCRSTWTKMSVMHLNSPLIQRWGLVLLSRGISPFWPSSCSHEPDCGKQSRHAPQSRGRHHEKASAECRCWSPEKDGRRWKVAVYMVG